LIGGIIKDQRINEEIRANEVFLIDENGRALGKVAYDQAMWLAFAKELDLVEINPNINPPVCKIIDYNKELYRRTKELQKQKSKAKNTELKEIRLSLKIGKHDFDVKAERTKEFFENGSKVKVVLILIGREMAFQENAKKVIDEFVNAVQGECEVPVKREGKRFWTLIKKKK